MGRSDVAERYAVDYTKQELQNFLRLGGLKKGCLEMDLRRLGVYNDLTSRVYEWFLGNVKQALEIQESGTE